MFLKLLESWHLTVDSHHNLISCGSKPSLMSFSQTLVGHVTGKSPKNTAENHVSGCFRQIVQTKPLTVLFFPCETNTFFGGSILEDLPRNFNPRHEQFCSVALTKNNSIPCHSHQVSWLVHVSIYLSIDLSIYLNLSIWIYMYVCM